jgi:hypothetical protein
VSASCKGMLALASWSAILCLMSYVALPASAALPAGSDDGATSPSPWTVVASPDTAGLNSVSCASSTSCVAVGPYNDEGGQTLIEYWNGSSWSVMTSPNEGNSVLEAVSCVDPTDCVAVGSASPTGSKSETLIESFDGTEWSIVPSPNAAGHNELWGVSCTSATDCMAVGSSGDTEPDPTWVPLVETWNGTDWILTKHPHIGSDVLTSVSCSGPSDCMVVGFPEYAENGRMASWNGSKWKVYSIPTVGKGSLPYAVTCPTSTYCVAVGSYSDSSYNERTLVLFWHGGNWFARSSPSPGAGSGKDASEDELSSVACTGKHRCVAVGLWNKSLVEVWNGTSWQIAKSGNLGKDDVLNGASCPTPTSCEAVGAYYETQSGNEVGLVEAGSD